MTGICARRRRRSPVPAVLARLAFLIGSMAVAWLLGHATAVAAAQQGSGEEFEYTRQMWSTESAEPDSADGRSRPDAAERVRRSIAAAESSSERDRTEPDRSGDPGDRDAEPAREHDADEERPPPPGEHRAADEVAEALREHRERAHAEEHHHDDAAPSGEASGSAAPSTGNGHAAKKPSGTSTAAGADHRVPDHAAAPAPARAAATPPSSSAETLTTGTAPAVHHESDLPRPRAPTPDPRPLPAQLPASSALLTAGSGPGTNGLRGMAATLPQQACAPVPSPDVPGQHAMPVPCGAPQKGPAVSPD